MTRKHQPFYRVTALVRARDIQTPLAVSVEQDANAYEAYVRVATEGVPTDIERISLILQDGVPVGWWWPFDEEISEGDASTVVHYMRPIPLSQMTSSDASFYDLADTFARKSHPFLFVLTATEITGTVSRLDLFSRLGQLCLLSLAFYLENVAEELCLHKPEECWKALSEPRRELAKKVCAKRYGPRQVQIPYLVKCTTFADKATMLAKTDLVPAMTKNELKSVIGTAERVRNLCAHGGTDHELAKLLPQARFSRFLHKSQDAIETLRRRLRELED